MAVLGKVKGKMVTDSSSQGIPDEPQKSTPASSPIPGVKADGLPVVAAVKEEESKEEEKPEGNSPRSVSVKEESPAGGEPSAVKGKPQEGPSTFRRHFQEINQPTSGSGGSGKKIALIGLVVLIGLGLIGGGIWMYKKGLSKINMPAISLSSPEPTPTETPMPTPTPGIKREDLKIQVLNGSGVAGVAGKVKELLEGLGYPEVETGNADSYDYEETEVSIKEDKNDYLDLLTEDLSEEYTLASESSILEEDSDFDAVVIVGKE